MAEAHLSVFRGTPETEGTFVPFPPHEGAGNVDTRHLTQGTTFHIPVHLPGAHFCPTEQPIFAAQRNGSDFPLQMIGINRHVRIDRKSV